MDRREAMKGAASSLFAAALWPRRAHALIWHGGSAVSQTVHDLILNIGRVTYADNQQMCLNILKQCGSNDGLSAWSTLSSGGSDTLEEAYLPQILNSSGYPTTLTLTTPPAGGQQFTKLLTSSLRSLTTPPNASGPYPAGSYRFGTQGQFTGTLGGDFTVSAQTLPSGITVNGLSGAISAQGTNAVIASTNSVGVTSYITLNVATATTAGYQWTLTAVPNSANPPANFTCVQSAYTTQFDAGQIFHPNFLAWLEQVPWKALRFMDSLCINSSVLTASFASDPTSGSALPALSTAWAGTSGQKRTTLATGEELLVTFTTSSTAVTSTANPTVTASSGTFWYFAFDSWSGRPQVTDFTYATNRGIPYEIAMDLCNTLGCSPWLNVPAQLQSADWASFASLLVANNTSGKKAFIEIFNEAWNGSFLTYHLLLAKSIFLWGGSGDPGSYIGMSVAQMAGEIATTAGNPGFDNGFLVLMPGQAASTGWLTTELTSPSWVSHGGTAPYAMNSASGKPLVQGTSIAPYAGNGPIYAADFTHMSGEGDGGYTDFFATLTQNPVGGYTYHDNNGNALPSGGWFAIAAGYVSSTVTAISPYGALPIYCYEGSWQFDANGASGQANFLTTAARDSRMASLQQIYFRTLAAAGCTPAQYNFCYPYGTYQWGLIESPMQTETPLTSTPARWQGAVNYVLHG